MADVRDAAQFGVRIKGEVRGRLPGDQGADAATAGQDLAPRLRDRFSRELGVDGSSAGRAFTSKNTVQVGDKTLRFAKAVVATGATPTLPPIPGLMDAPVLTNLNLFNLTSLPPRLGVIGAGVIVWRWRKPSLASAPA